MQTKMRPNVPMEILDRILASIPKDCKSWSTLLLVCWYIHDIAAKKLFTVLTINDYSSVAFTDRFLAALPSVARFLQRLEIRLATGGGRLLEGLAPVVEAQRLRYLKIVSIGPRVALQPDTPLCNLTLMASVKDLHLARIDDIPNSLLSDRPLLDYLCLDNAHFLPSKVGLSLGKHIPSIGVYDFGYFSEEDNQNHMASYSAQMLDYECVQKLCNPLHGTHEYLIELSL